MSRFPKTKCLNRLGWANHKCAQQGKVIGICLRHHIQGPAEISDDLLTQL
jgi:hypothetical protein